MKKVLSTILTVLALTVTSLAVSVSSAVAGTNLTVGCPAIGSCSVSPAATPLFNEGGWVPGSGITQYIRMSNTSAQNGFAAVEVHNYSETNTVGEVINIVIRRDSPVGPVIYTAPDLHTFRDDGYFTIDTLSSGETTEYFFTAEMAAAAGNQYQGSQVIFDLRAGLEIAAIPPTSGGGGGGSGGGGGGGGPASPPVCNATVPSSAPSLSITNVGTNTVSLSWTPVSPVTHYALVFTRTSDGAQYGSTNIGNVTSYTVTNLSGGANYTFEVFGVNDCAPGPRSTQSSPQIPGPVLEGRPTGPGGAVLGVEEEASASASVSEGDTTDTLGQVAGTIAEACSQWRFFIPWILLIIQFLLILASELYFRQHQGWTKHFVTIGITLVSIALFYWLRACDCYNERSFLAWLCRWYWIVAILDSLLVRGISYAFIEDSEAKDWERKLKTATKPSDSVESVTTFKETTTVKETVAKPEKSEKTE